jgi:hypothetical protein
LTKASFGGFGKGVLRFLRFARTMIRFCPPAGWIGFRLALCCASAFAVVEAVRGTADAADPGSPAVAPLRKTAPDPALLSPAEWGRLDRAVNNALLYISRRQQPDGSFPTKDEGQPGVTSICVMAFLARGHQPGKGPYGSLIERAIDFTLDLQDPDVGSIMADRWVGPRHDRISRIGDGMPRSFTGNYNHGIAGVMLAEVYGMTDARRHERIHKALVKALEYTRKQQLRFKRNPDDRGGWRYVHMDGTDDSDLSVTAWQLMFLRSARNAEFNVPKEWTREAIEYVHRTFDQREKMFRYGLSQEGRYFSRGMVGAGVVCLELGGEHNSEMARLAGNTILQSSFERYNVSSHRDDRYHYGAFYCSQAMYQLGGNYWHEFFPKLANTLIEAQNRDGSWDVETADPEFGNYYTTALTVLALATPYQLLPIYQR